MSALIFVGIFSLRNGHHVTTSFTKRSGEQGTTTHTHYSTALVCRTPPALPAELRVYSRSSDPFLPDNTVTIVVAKGYIPAGDVAGDLLLDALHIAPFPGNTSESVIYDRQLPDFHWPLLFGLGTVSGLSTELSNGQVSLPVSMTEFVRGSIKSSTVLYAFISFSLNRY